MSLPSAYPFHILSLFLIYFLLQSNLTTPFPQIPPFVAHPLAWNIIALAMEQSNAIGLGTTSPSKHTSIKPFFWKPFPTAQLAAGSCAQDTIMFSSVRFLISHPYSPARWRVPRTQVTTSQCHWGSRCCSLPAGNTRTQWE